MTVEYTRPECPVWAWADELITAPHVLIAGATGSGKNVLLDDLIWSLMGSKTPASAKFVLVDPKRVELVKYKNTYFCAGYASEPKDIIRLIDSVIDEMEKRYQAMQATGYTQYTGAHLYLIIDELADLMVTQKKDVLPRLQRLAQLGRSARVHVWACSQSPSRRTIPAELTLNFTHKIALRCDSGIESRQVIGISGAEVLPKHGEAFIRMPGELYRQKIPMTPDEDISQRIDLWKITNNNVKTNKEKKRCRLFRRVV